MYTSGIVFNSDLLNLYLKQFVRVLVFDLSEKYLSRVLVILGQAQPRNVIGFTIRALCLAIPCSLIQNVRQHVHLVTERALIAMVNY